MTQQKDASAVLNQQLFERVLIVLQRFTVSFFLLLKNCGYRRDGLKVFKSRKTFKVIKSFQTTRRS